MNDLIPPSAEDQQQLARQIQAVIAACDVFSRGTFILRHGLEDDMLPCVVDQFEFRNCRVENVFTLLLPSGQIYREVLFKVRGRSPAFVSSE